MFFAPIFHCAPILVCSLQKRLTKVICSSMMVNLSVISSICREKITMLLVISSINLFLCRSIPIKSSIHFGTCIFTFLPKLSAIYKQCFMHRACFLLTHVLWFFCLQCNALFHHCTCIRLLSLVPIDGYLDKLYSRQRAFYCLPYL